MSLLFTTPTATVPGPADDFWFTPLAPKAVTGHSVTADSAMKVSTVYACVRVLSSTLAMLPLPVYRRLENGGKDQARDHGLWMTLHDKPNPWQTSFQWRQMMMGHLILRGNAFSFKQFGTRGAVDALWPLHPDGMQLKEQRQDGVLIYEYTEPGTADTRRYTSDQLFRLTSLSSDGVSGLSLIAMMRDSVGLAMATEEHGGRLFKNGPLMRGLLKQTIGTAIDEQRATNLARQFSASQTGDNAHGIAVLPTGLEWEKIGMTAEDSQFLQTRGFQVEDILRFMGVPGNLVGHADKTATHASAEQFFQSFVTYHMSPWFVLWEQSIWRDLIDDDDKPTVFAEFNRDGLLQGDSVARAQFYRAMVELGIYTRNEVRIIENRNPLEGLDEPLTAKNMAVGGQEEASMPAADEGDGEAPPSRADAQMRAVVQAAAGRIARKEVTTLTKAATRFAGASDEWSAYVQAFYGKLATEITACLGVDPRDAEAYTDQRQHEAMMKGASVLEDWKTDAGETLSAFVWERIIQ